MNKIVVLLLIGIVSLSFIQTTSAAATLSIGTTNYDSTAIKDESITVTSSVSASSVSGTLTVDVTLTDNSGLFTIPTATQQLQFTTDGEKSVTWTITAKTAGTNNAPFTISASGDDDSFGTDTTSSPVTVKDRPILSVSTSTDKSSVSAGDSVTVSYVVSNSASGDAADATNVQIALTLPSGWSLTSGTNPYSLGSIAPGASSSGSWVVKADSPASSNTLTIKTTSTIPGGTITKTISVTGSSPGGSTSSSSSNRGAGTTSSGENNNNIQVSETKRQYISKDSKITYNFESEGNILQSITFTGLINAGSIAAEVEVLKDLSTMVDKPPGGVIFKNININVGNSGWASSDNIAGAKVFFTVDRSWIDTNNIDIATIALNRYSNGNWNSLKTTKTGHDSNSLKFEGETPGFSPFSITAEKISSTSDDEHGTGLGAESTTTGEATDTIPDKTSDDGGLPGFSIIAAIFGLIIAIRQIDKRKK